MKIRHPFYSPDDNPAGTPPATPPAAPPAGTPPADAGTPPAGGTPPADAGTPPAGDGSPEPGSKADTAPPESKAPEKYELTIPDGSADLIRPKQLEMLQKIARDNGWSNDEAQAALNDHLATVRAGLDEQNTQMLAEFQADPEYGGAKFDETKTLAQALIDRVRPVGHPRREAFLSAIGSAGNHVEIAAVMADLGRLTREDSPAHARAASASSATVADKLYDHPTSRALNEGS